ncbi:MAG: hypothetical protein FJ314_10770 [SAR202 cluster bacterium]|nr:hypothetical protein [SAR202 cluster bacterium]
MNINQAAPVFVRREITVFAPPDKVWDWLSRVDLWGDWHPEIASAYWLKDDVAGRRFRWRQGPVRITSTIEAWSEQREIGWTGRAYSAVVRHVFRLQGDFRQTHITSEQSIEGFPASVIGPIMRRLAERSSETWLAALKTRLESVHDRSARSWQPPRPPTLPSMTINRFRM